MSKNKQHSQELFSTRIKKASFQTLEFIPFHPHSTDKALPSQLWCLTGSLRVSLKCNLACVHIFGSLSSILQTNLAYIQHIFH